MVMISAGTAFAASDDAVLGDANDDSVIAESVIDDTSNVLNSYATDELIDDGENVLSADDERINTTIRASANVSYSRPVVAEGFGVYVFDFTPDNSSTPLFVTKNITVQFGDELPINCSTFGVGMYIIPNSTTAGNYSITLTFAGDEKYGGSCFTTNIEIYDVETEITALGNMSYPRIAVKNGYGYYPLILNTNTTVPMPLANRTVLVSFNKGKYEEFSTNGLGIVSYVIPNDTIAGNYSIDVVYKGDDGYIGSEFTADLEVYNIETMVLAFDNMTYSRPSVIDGDAIYPIMLTTNMSVEINGSVIPIPIPLANRTVLVSFDNGEAVNFTTDALGLINYTIPYVDKEGNYTIWMLYDGEDGYDYSKLTTTVEIYDVETQILSLGNVSYPRPLVIEGLGYYPLMLTTNVSIEINGTKVNIPVPLANKTVSVQFEMYTPQLLTTDAFGLINYTIPYVSMEGNYTISAFFYEDGYVSSNSRATVEIYDVETQIISLGNASYPRPLVIEGLGYYPIMLTGYYYDLNINDTVIPIALPLANRTVWISFNGTGAYYNTSEYGIVNYVIPNDTLAGNYSIDIAFDSQGPMDEGYEPTSLVTTVEIYDVETQIFALGDVSYPAPLVAEGLGYYPIGLTTDLGFDIFNVTVPVDIPLANKTVAVVFGSGHPVNYTTNEYGIVNYVIPNDTLAGNYTISMFFNGGDGYIRTMVEYTVEVYDVETKLHTLGDVSYPTPLVAEGYGYYPIGLTTDLGFDIFNVTVPVDIPLANKTVAVVFGSGHPVNYTTNEYGMVYYVIPNDTLAGNYTISMFFNGGDGYIRTMVEYTVEVYDVETKLHTLGDVSYPAPLVAEGYGYYPIGLTTDLGFDIFNVTVPVDIPLANKTVAVVFGSGHPVNYTTDEYGMVYYVIPNDTLAGNYTISMFFNGGDGYFNTMVEYTVEVYDVETRLHALGDVSYPAPLVAEGYGYYPIGLTTDLGFDIFNVTVPVDIPLANKTVAVVFGSGHPVNYTTDEYGMVYYVIPNDTLAGNYTISMFFDGGDGYFNTMVEYTVEVWDVPTQIFALDNVSYPGPVVAEGYGYYPIALTTDLGFDIFNVTVPVDIPLANKTVWIAFCDEDPVNFTTDEYGMVYYVIPEYAEAGNHTIWIEYDGGDGYDYVNLTTTVEIWDVPTKIHALGNVSYPHSLVEKYAGIVPFALTTDLGFDIFNTTIPVDIPLDNMTLWIAFDDDNFTEAVTTKSGIAYYIIPEHAEVGNHTITVLYEGEGGFMSSNITISVEIYDISSKITPLKQNVTYEYREVLNKDATYTLFLTTNTTIPLPLANRDVYIEFNGVGDYYITDLVGIVTYRIPNVPAGNYTISMLFEGDGVYAATETIGNIEIQGVNTRIIADSNMTVLVKDLDSTYFNLTLVDEYGNHLGGQNITIEFNGIVGEYCTDENGTINYPLFKSDAGNYTITMNFAGAVSFYDYALSNASALITVEKENSKIFLRNALYFVTEEKMVKVTLWDANNKPIAGKTVYIKLDEYTWRYSGVTDENGDAYIRVGVGYGVHGATVMFDGDDEYAASNRTGSIRVIKQTPSIMVRGNNTQFKVSDNPKTVNVYLWDRYSKPLPVNSKVAIKINGQTYIGNTDANGIAKINININRAGIYNAEISFAGNSAYNAVKRTIKIKVV